MILNRVIAGNTNCYLLIDEKTKQALLVDCVGNPQKYLDILKEYGAKLEYIYLTHLHYDHIESVQELKNLTNAKVLISEEDGKNINNPQVVLLDGIDEITVDEFVKDKDEIKLGDYVFEVLSTPGHTMGSTCIYNEKEKILFSGDTMFLGTYGRCDLPTGSQQQMRESLVKLLKLPIDTQVFPGHGEETTIGNEVLNYSR